MLIAALSENIQANKFLSLEVIKLPFHYLWHLIIVRKLKKVILFRLSQYGSSRLVPTQEYEPEHDKTYTITYTLRILISACADTQSYQLGSQMSQLMRLWYLTHRRPAKGPTKNQTSSPTGWLRMRV